MFQNNFVPRQFPLYESERILTEKGAMSMHGH